MTFDNNDNPHGDRQKNNKKDFNLGIVLGIFYYVVPLIITYITYALLNPSITVLLCYIIIVSILVTKRKFEILKGFILGTILVPFILIGACFGILIIIQLFMPFFSN